MKENYNNKEKSLNSWTIFLIYLLIIGILSLFTFKDRIIENFKSGSNNQETINNSSSTNSNIKDKLLGKKTLTCTKTEIDEEGNENKEDIILTYKNNKVIKYENSTIVKTSDENIDLALTLYQSFANILSELDGITMDISKITDNSYKILTTIVYDELNEEQVNQILSETSEETSISDYNFYKKNINISDLKTELSSEYNCN